MISRFAPAKHFIRSLLHILLFSFTYFAIYAILFLERRWGYGGEVIPVDFLSASFAEQFGFKPLKVYCLKQQKGNSG